MDLNRSSEEFLEDSMVEVAFPNLVLINIFEELLYG